MNVRACPGCNVVLSFQDYPADNRYGVVSPECRAAFDTILALEGERYDYPPAHRLIIDSYGVQHPPHREVQQQLGISERFIKASIQSVAIHLIALYCALEKKMELRSIAAVMDHVLTSMARQGIVFEELQAPADLGSQTKNTNEIGQIKFGKFWKLRDCRTKFI